MLKQSEVVVVAVVMVFVRCFPCQKTGVVVADVAVAMSKGVSGNQLGKFTP